MDLIVVVNIMLIYHLFIDLFYVLYSLIMFYYHVLNSNFNKYSHRLNDVSYGNHTCLIDE